MKNIWILFAVVIMTGCGGTNTLRVSTVPTSARLYADGEYRGITPASIPQSWGPWGIWGDATEIRIEKEGYKVFRRTIPNWELTRRWWAGNRSSGSEFGFGWVYPYTFTLEPDAQEQ